MLNNLCWGKMTDFDYSGDIDPKESWDLLKSNENSYLIDCRTKAEWQFVGVPDLESINRAMFLIEWQVYPSMLQNQEFLDQVNKANIKKDSNIVIICRSGGRSKSAAQFLTSQGYKNCFNCLFGFEGDHDVKGHRGVINGWKFSKLPWKQT